MLTVSRLGYPFMQAYVNAAFPVLAICHACASPLKTMKRARNRLPCQDQIQGKYERWRSICINHPHILGLQDLSIQTQLATRSPF